MVSLICGSNVVVSAFWPKCISVAHVAHTELYLPFWALYLWLIGLNLQVGNVLRSVSLSLIMSGMTYPKDSDFPQSTYFLLQTRLSPPWGVMGMLSGMAAGVTELRNAAAREVGLSSHLILAALILDEQGRSQPHWSSSMNEIKAFASKSNCVAVRKFHLYQTGRE